MTTIPFPAMHPGAFGRAMLCLLMLWSAMQLGAGLYEKQVVIPQWAEGATPATLSDQLAASGHTTSSTRFWPFISPVVFLLALINAVVAWRHPGPARRWWLFASITLLLMSIATYAYFVPTMLAMMHRAGTYSPQQLSGMLEWWLNLSWLRSAAALPAWLAAAKALTLLGGQPGGGI